MRSLFSFACLVLFSVGCRKQDAVSPIAAAVNSFKDLPAAYQPIQGGSSMPGRLKSEKQNGKLSGEWLYNERGQFTEWRIFRLGEIQSAVQYHYDAESRLRFVQHFGNACAHSSVYNCTGPVVWESYDDLTTNAAGRVIESRTYLKVDGSWDFRSLSQYEYNAQGQMTKAMLYDDTQALTLTQTLTYDARGNVVTIREQRTPASSNPTDRTVVYDYDTGQNPYFNTVYFPSAFFLSPNTQLIPGLTYDYRSDGQPSRINQNGSVTELTYY